MPSHRPRIPESKFCQGIYLRRSLFGLLESKKVDGYSRAILKLVTKPKETSQLTKIYSRPLCPWCNLFYTVSVT